jgi:hypothetical protein
MSVSSQPDAEGDVRLTWVAAAVARRGGEVDQPSLAEHADD